MGKIIKWLMLDLITKELQFGNIINANEHGFTENKPCQINLIP